MSSELIAGTFGATDSHVGRALSRAGATMTPTRAATAMAEDGRDHRSRLTKTPDHTSRLFAESAMVEVPAHEVEAAPPSPGIYLHIDVRADWELQVRRGALPTPHKRHDRLGHPRTVMDSLAGSASRNGRPH